VNLRISGAKLRQARKRLRLTQIDLAEEVRVNQAHISRLETGDRGARRRTLERLARALKVRSEELLAGEPGEK